MSERRIRTKEKKKRARSKIRKHVLRLVFWLFALLLVSWALAGWYLGGKAEQAVKAYLQTHSEIVGEKLLRIELLSYRKTLFGAKAQLRISSDIPVISEQIGEVVIRAKLLNGPLFITKKGMSVGSSRWFLQFDEVHLSENERQNMQVFFPEEFPTAVVITDFKQKAHYFAKIKTHFTHALLTGIYTFETENQEEYNRGAITLSDFSYGVASNTLTAKTIKISYQHQKAISANYKPGTTSIVIPVLKLHISDLDKTLILKVNTRTNLSSLNSYLSGFIKFNFEKLNTENHSENDIPFDTAKLTLWFKGLSAEGLVTYSEAHADLDNLKQQIDWTIEDLGEFPEGRDEINHLYDKVESNSKKLNNVIIKEIFQDDKSLLRLEFEAQHVDGISQAKIGLKPTDNALIKGEGQLDLSYKMQRFIADFLKENENVAILLSKKQFKFLFKDNKLLYQ